MMNVRTVVSQVGQAGRATCNLTARRAYANLAYNSTSQPTNGEVPTLDRKLDSLEERIQARRDALGANAKSTSDDHSKESRARAETSSPLEATQAPKKGIMSILPGKGNPSIEALAGRCYHDINWRCIVRRHGIDSAVSFSLMPCGNNP